MSTCNTDTIFHWLFHVEIFLGASSRGVRAICHWAKQVCLESIWKGGAVSRHALYRANHGNNNDAIDISSCQGEDCGEGTMRGLSRLELIEAGFVSSFIVHR